MERIDFNNGWLFSRADTPENSTEVNLPHDAMLYEQRNPNTENGANTAWFPGGIYLYRKSFHIPSEFASKYVAFEFEGVYHRVKVNNAFIHSNGYTGFYVVPDMLKYGDENTIEVIVDNSQEPNSRWYSGSGIYRNVSMIVGHKTHIAPDGIMVATLSIEPAIVEVSVDAPEGEIAISIYDSNGALITSANGHNTQITIPNAQKWSADTPCLYTAHVTLSHDGTVLDTQSVTFGIRIITWSARRGLRINGIETKLRGACIHHDNGILGACAFRDAEYRKIRLLKEAGFNAIRSSHNPCSRALLDACDEYGMYVMDEAFDQWYIPKTKHDYSRDFESNYRDDLAGMVRKDYNHPSVIMYSLGNEISETAQPRGIQLTKEMTGYVKSLDSTRPVTCGINLFLNGLISKGIGIYKEDGEGITGKSSNKKMQKLAGSAFYNYIMEHLSAIKSFISKAKFADKATREAFAYLDICGYNYGVARYIMDGKKYPDRIIVGSETFIPELYKAWQTVVSNPHVIGDFIWVGWDYLGEAGIGMWSYDGNGGMFSRYPMLLANSGCIDVTGFTTPECRFVQVALEVSQGPYIGVRPVQQSGRKCSRSPWRSTDAVESWSWAGCEGNTAHVEVYSRGASVTLRLNGAVTGRGYPKDGIARFDIPYLPGLLEAEAYDINGISIGVAALQTANDQTQLTVIPENDSINLTQQSLCYLDIRITDENGIVKVLEDRIIHVTVEGAGVLQGLGSANPCTTDSFVMGSYTSYYGRAQAVVRCSGSVGNINVTVCADGLEPVTVCIAVIAEEG